MAACLALFAYADRAAGPIEPPKRSKEKPLEMVTWDRSLLDRLEELLTKQGLPKQKASGRVEGQLMRVADSLGVDMTSPGSPRP